MKHFTIQTEEQAASLDEYAVDPMRVGYVVYPSVACIEECWRRDYPEADALTFEQCMAIVRDEVTEDVLRELGDVEELFSDTLSLKIVTPEFGTHAQITLDRDGDVALNLDLFGEGASIEIPNPTSTKIKLLTKILRGQ